MVSIEKCKELMGVLFGPASAKTVDAMARESSPEEAIRRCRQKVRAILGEEKAKLFD